MTLTIGTGPFSHTPAGVFNFTIDAPERVLYFEDSPRRVRVVVGGETIAESTRAKLLHETTLLPVIYLPLEDVETRFLVASEHATHCPFKGDATYWSIRVGDDERRDAVWSYPEPLPGAPALDGYVAFTWDAVDEWWEEAERMRVHPRDPYHRCDVVRADRHVVVRVDGQTVAESRRPTMLFETGLPPRFYLPEDDVDEAVLEPSTARTSCPYKGDTTRYYSLVVDGTRVDDAAWVYDEPLAEVSGIAGLVAFYGEHVDLEVDGEAWARPVTRFS